MCITGCAHRLGLAGRAVGGSSWTQEAAHSTPRYDKMSNSESALKALTRLAHHTSKLDKHAGHNARTSWDAPAWVGWARCREASWTQDAARCPGHRPRASLSQPGTRSAQHSTVFVPVRCTAGCSVPQGHSFLALRQQQLTASWMRDMAHCLGHRPSREPEPASVSVCAWRC